MSRDRVRQAVLFVAVSGTGWVLDTAVFLLLAGPGNWPVILANMASGCCGALLVFVVSARGIFRRNGGSMPQKVAVLLPFNALVILCSSLALGGIAVLLGRGSVGLNWNLSPDALRLAAKVLVTPATLALNFVVVRHLVERFVGLSARPVASGAAR